MSREAVSELIYEMRWLVEANDDGECWAEADVPLSKLGEVIKAVVLEQPCGAFHGNAKVPGMPSEKWEPFPPKQ